MASFFDNAVERITIETEWLPTIELVQPFARGSGGAPTPATPGATKPKGQSISQVLKPRVTVETSFGAPLVSAPYGTPTQNWPYLRLLLILGIALGGVVTFRTMRALHECRKLKRSK